MDADDTGRRKGEHLQLAAEGDVESLVTAGWEDVHLVHDAVPTVDASSIDLSTRLLGRSCCDRATSRRCPRRMCARS